jgi:uncharacterized protein (TIGR03000 family)
LLLSLAVISWVAVPGAQGRGSGHGGHSGGGHSGGHSAGHSGGGSWHGGSTHAGSSHGSAGTIHNGNLHHGSGYHLRGFGYGGFGYPGYGFGYGGYGFGLSGLGSYYDPGYYDDGSGYADPGYDYPPPNYRSGSYQPLDTQDDSAPATMTTLITLKVPANAKVWFNGTKMKQTGTERSFVSPPLLPGYSYQYQIRASWTDAQGQTVTRTRDVDLHPGENINLEFGRTAPKEP